jgi:hypothetical protein
MFKNKWNFLFLILAVLVLFSLFAVPKIAISNMDAEKGKIVTVES